MTCGRGTTHMMYNQLRVQYFFPTMGSTAVTRDCTSGIGPNPCRAFRICPVTVCSETNKPDRDRECAVKFWGYVLTVTTLPNTGAISFRFREDENLLAAPRMRLISSGQEPVDVVLSKMLRNLRRLLSCFDLPR